jgi:Ribonuclease P 40kDa (Rpp40) subunit
MGTSIDCDNCVCLSPTGTLVLNLNRVDYERLGLEGQPSFFCRLKPPSRYGTYYFNFVLDILNNQFYVTVVKIDLTEECFKPNKKNYERVIKCLLQNLKLEMDFIIAWNPPSKII